MTQVLEVKQGIWIDEQLLRHAGIGRQWQVLVQPGEIRILPVAGSDAQASPEDRLRVNWTAADASEQVQLLQQIREELTPYTLQTLQIGLEEEDWEALLG